MLLTWKETRSKTSEVIFASPVNISLRHLSGITILKMDTDPLKITSIHLPYQQTHGGARSGIILNNI